jgi:hypothetical protein
VECTPLTQHSVPFCPHQVVDLTGETRRLASGLSEAHLRCDERQRDEFLYYILVWTTSYFDTLAADHVDESSVQVRYW